MECPSGLSSGVTGVLTWQLMAPKGAEAELPEAASKTLGPGIDMASILLRFIG